MSKKARSGTGMLIPDYISESLETFFWVKILKFFDADPDPGSGMERIRIQDPRLTSRIRNTGWLRVCW
jgi:hypothetical protein